MPSTPLICCSSGAATVSAMTFGLAPGYTARTTTVGGTTLGYSLTGRRSSARLPAARISTEMTTAKIGRSMKNRASFMGCSPSAFARVTCVALRRDRSAVARVVRVALRRDRSAVNVRGRALFVHRDEDRLDLHPRPQPLQAVDDHAIPRRQARARDPEPVDDRSERDPAILNRLVRRDDEHEALVEIGA